MNCYVDVVTCSISFKEYDKGVMISISVTADKYSRNVLSVLYMQIFFILYLTKPYSTLKLGREVDERAYVTPG